MSRTVYVTGAYRYLLFGCKSACHTLLENTMEAVKNKGGRPTKAEQAAKGIVETELKKLLLMFRKSAPVMVGNLLEQLESSQLTLKDKIKLQIDLLKMYESLLKTNKALLASADKDGDGGLDSKDPDDLPSQPIFRLAG